MRYSRISIAYIGISFHFYFVVFLSDSIVIFVFQPCISILELMTMYLQVLGDLLCTDAVICAIGFRLVLLSFLLSFSLLLCLSCIANELGAITTCW